MGDDGQFIIRIGIPRGDVSGAEQAEQALHKSRQAAEEFIHTLKLGVGIDLGGKLVESIQEIPNLLREATAEGVKFNAFLETTQIAIAGSLRSVDPSLTWQQAKQEGGEAIDLLRKKANELGLDFETLAETYKVNAPTLAHAGIKDVQQQIDTIALLNQVAAAKGIQGFQSQRDIIDILNGQGNRTLLGKELESQGVDMKELENAERLGTLYDYLTEKLGAFKQAGQEAAQTLNGEMNTLHNEIQQALGEGAKPVFDTLKQGVAELNQELQDPQVVAALESLGHDIAGLVDDGVKLTEWALKNADALVEVGRGATLLATAFAAIKIKDLIVGLGAMALGFGENTTAIAAETDALVANTAAQEANATARAANGAASAGGIFARGAGVLAEALNPIALGAVIGAGAAEWQDSISPDQARHTDEAGKLGALWKGRKEQLAGLSSPAERDQFEKQVQADLLDLSKKRNGADEESAALIDAATHQLQKYLEAARAISEEKLRQLEVTKKQHEAEQADADNKRRQKELDSSIADWRAKKGSSEAVKVFDDLGQDAVKKARDAAEKGQDSSAIRDWIMNLKGTISDNQKFQPQTLEQAKSHDALMDHLNESLRKAQDAEGDRKKIVQQKQDEISIKQLEHQRAAAEEMGKARIAQLEAVGGKEDDIARKRKEIEDQVAAQRLAIEDKIGFLQKETPDDKKARHDLAASQQTERDADLAKVLREHKEKAQGDAWDKNRLPGRIDARTQRVVGANGDDLEFHGVAKYGRDAMGEPLQPSMLDSMHGAGWDQPRRKFGDVMPPASQPGGSHTDAQGLKQPVDQTAAALAEVKQSLTVLANSARELAGTAKQTAQQVDAASRETGTSMSGQARTVTQTAAVVKEAVAATEKAMEEIQRELHDMQRREADGRHR